MSFIDDHKEENGIEPICAVLPIAPSTYYRHKYLEKHPEARSARAKRDEALCETISEVWTKNRRVFGVRKVWRRLRRTTGSGSLYGGPPNAPAGPARRDPRQGAEDNDPCGGTPFGFGTAGVQSRPAEPTVGIGLDVRSHLAGFCVCSLRHRCLLTADLGMAGIPLLADGSGASVGSKGDSYDNALAETVIGLYKTELIQLQRPWRNLEHVELETLGWISWFNRDRLMERLDWLTPIKYEAEYDRETTQANVARVREPSLRQNRGDSPCLEIRTNTISAFDGTQVAGLDQ